MMIAWYILSLIAILIQKPYIFLDVTRSNIFNIIILKVWIYYICKPYENIKQKVFVKHISVDGTYGNIMFHLTKFFHCTYIIIINYT